MPASQLTSSQCMVIQLCSGTAQHPGAQAVHLQDLGARNAPGNACSCQAAAELLTQLSIQGHTSGADKAGLPSYIAPACRAPVVVCNPCPVLAACLVEVKACRQDISAGCVLGCPRMTKPLLSRHPSCWEDINSSHTTHPLAQSWPPGYMYTAHQAPAAISSACRLTPAPGLTPNVSSPSLFPSQASQRKAHLDPPSFRSGRRFSLSRWAGVRLKGHTAYRWTLSLPSTMARVLAEKARPLFWRTMFLASSSSIVPCMAAAGACVTTLHC